MRSDRDAQRGRGRAGLGVCLLLASAAPAVAAGHAGKVACDEDNGGLRLPPGFCALVVADDLGTARDLTVAPNGDVYVAIDGPDGGVAALRDMDGDGRLELVERFGSGAGSGVQYHDDHLYFSSDLFILRYPLLGGLLVPSAAPEIILTGLLPQRTRHFEVDDDDGLYVDMDRCETQARVSATASQEGCEREAGVWRFSADTPNQDAATQGQRYSTGRTDGIFNAVETGNGKVYAVTHRSESAFAWPGEYSDMLFYTGKLFPSHYRGGAFVATAGTQSGAHRVDFVSFTHGKPAGAPERFVEGFARADALRTAGDPRDRPLGLALGPDGSLYVSDSDYGRIWRIYYRD
jgi:glucose/arabinose dehydrogenase